MAYQIPRPSKIVRGSESTVSIPLRKHQTLKFSYNNGAYVNYGGDYQNVSVAWQYSWLGRPD